MGRLEVAVGARRRAEWRSSSISSVMRMMLKGDGDVTRRLRERAVEWR